MPRSKCAHHKPVILLGAGDIMYCRSECRNDPRLCGFDETASLIKENLTSAQSAGSAVYVFTTGDNVYFDDKHYKPGDEKDFKDDGKWPMENPNCYCKGKKDTWGEFADRTYPVFGNHDLEFRRDENSEPLGRYPESHYRTFRHVYGDDDGNIPGYYSVDLLHNDGSLSDWTLLVLNNSIESLRQEEKFSFKKHTLWLDGQLADLASRRRSIITLWHEPVYIDRDGVAKTIDWSIETWPKLVGKASLVLTGLHHSYQRFFPKGADLRRDDHGLTQIVVGTGGARLHDLDHDYRIGDGQIAREYRGIFGIIRLTLFDSNGAERPHGNWEFLGMPAYRKVDRFEARTVLDRGDFHEVG